MPTIKDVARVADVSFKTVSRVINNDKQVKPQTRERVQEVIRELGYRPKHAAQMMRTQRSQSIGFITDQVASTPYAVGFIKGAQDRAWMEEKILLIVNTEGETAVQQRAVELMVARQVEGIVYATMYRQALDTFPDTAGLPVVLLNCSMKDDSLSAVLPDDYGAARQATELCLQKGHTRIGYINLLDKTVAAEERLAGYRDALEQHGIAFQPELVHIGYLTLMFKKSVAVEAATALMSLAQPPTAIFCGNDHIAMAVYETLKDLGKKIPHDVAIIGFDDEQLVTLNLTPTLSSMDFPFFTMGRRAIHYLLEDWKQDPTPQQIIMPCPYIERNSL